MSATRCGRRLAIWAALLVTACAPLLSWAQGYPNQQIRIIVPVPAGGGVDLLARSIGQKLAGNLNVPVVIDNRPGASAAIGTADLAKAPPDGYTIMMAYSAHATNPIFNPNLPYNTDKDFTAINFVGYIPLILVTPVNSGLDSVAKLIETARAKPGSLAYASGVPPPGSTPWPAIFWRTSGIARIFTTSALSRSMTGFGVLAGANRPNQAVTSNPGKPDSATVGTFGSSDVRRGPVTASARRRPLSMCCSTDGMVEKYTCT